MTDLSRRSLLSGLGFIAAAPAIVRVGSLMPVKVIEPRALVGFTDFDTNMYWLQQQLQTEIAKACGIPLRMLIPRETFLR
jgi:hypothetical protein